jgi:hypothetical protein
MIYGIAIAIFTLVIDEVTDYKLWLKNRNLYMPKGSVNHKKGTLLRCIGLIPATWFISHTDGWYHINHFWIYTNLIWIAGAMLFFWYWTLFDGVFNIATKQKGFKGFFRVGTTNVLDIMQKNWPTWLRATAKVGGMIVFTYLFFHLK